MRQTSFNELTMFRFYDSFPKLLGPKKLQLILSKYGTILVTFTVTLYIYIYIYISIYIYRNVFKNCTLLMRCFLLYVTLQVFFSKNTNVIRCYRIFLCVLLMCSDIKWTNVFIDNTHLKEVKN